MAKLGINQRKCTSCNERYFRVNSMEIWTVRAPGSHSGWFKEVAKVCNKCMGIKEARRIFGMVGVSLSKPAKEKILTAK